MITYTNATKAAAKLPRDTGPCGIYALATATNTDYTVCAELLYSLGKTTNAGTPFHTIWIKAAAMLGYQTREMAYGKGKYKTGDYADLIGSHWKTIAAKLAKRDPEGIYAVITQGSICHVATCKGGEIQDWNKDGGHRVNWIFKLVKASDPMVASLPKPKRKLRHKTAAKLGINPKTGLSVS